MNKINNSINDYKQKIDEINKCQKEIKVILEIIKTKERELEEAHKMIKKRQDAIANKEKEAEEIKKSKEYRLDLIQQSQIVCKDNLMRMQEFIIYKQLIFCQEITKNFIICPQVAIKAFIDNEERKESGDYEIFNRYKELYVDFLLILKDFSKNSSIPFAVLEFYGKGHYQSENVEANDKVKEMVCRKAGLEYIVLRIEDICQKTNDTYIDDFKLKAFVETLATNLNNVKKS